MTKDEAPTSPKDAALTLALEALERVAIVGEDCGILSPSLADAVDEAIAATKEALAQPEQEPDYREALRVLSLALEEAPTGLTPKQRSIWQQSKDVLLSGGGMA